MPEKDPRPEEEHLYEGLQEAIYELPEKQRARLLAGLKVDDEIREKQIELHKELLNVYKDYFGIWEDEAASMEKMDYTSLLVEVWSLPEGARNKAQNMLEGLRTQR